MQSPRSQYIAEHPMVDQLMRAVESRIKAEETFKTNIVSELKRLILTLAECDPSNARTALDLTQAQLGSIISRLNDNHIISTTEASKIANIVKENNLFRGPTPLPLPPSDLPVPPLTAPPTSLQPNPPLGPITNPGAVQSSGINDGRTTPGRTPQMPRSASTTGPARGGRKTRRRRKTRR